MTVQTGEQLNRRWYSLRYHSEQSRLFRSKSRFRVVPPGRRSGKTEIAKRHLIDCAIDFLDYDDGRFVFGAPTIPQARQIYWNDLKRMTNVPGLRLGKPNESRLEVTLANGARIQVHGCDKPERLEGDPIDGIVLDEYGNMKKEVWDEHIRPGLDTPDRPGWAWFIGVPEGRNHYYKLYLKAIAERDLALKEGRIPRWDMFHWPSWDILDAEAIDEAKKDLDELTFRQEYGGEFVDFGGRAYYCFQPEYHAIRTLPYDPNLPLMVCFDFNVAPGVAVIAQEHATTDANGRPLKWCEGIEDLDPDGVTCIIGEVWIERNSNTPKVCKKISQDWGDHRGEVHCYGDATGGARHTSQTEGTDWDLILDYLNPTFGQKLHLYKKKKNPPERVRVNAVNSRLRTADGHAHMLVDPHAAPHTVDDLDRCTCDEVGELDKDTDKTLTHLTDAFGYYVEIEHSISSSEMSTVEY